ncbi:uncharacterized protein [Nicotiana tomentosiformis]|uniref:uncharacterized protein isoform X2 n=1 Tax=Nicotiana tomentosiformis TaxID=4098 RepID=UPI00051B0F66
MNHSNAFKRDKKKRILFCILLYTLPYLQLFVHKNVSILVQLLSAIGLRNCKVYLLFVTTGICYNADIANVKATLISAKYHGNGMLLFILHLFTLMEDYLITQTRIQNTSADGAGKVLIEEFLISHCWKPEDHFRTDRHRFLSKGWNFPVITIQD